RAGREPGLSERDKARDQGADLLGPLALPVDDLRYSHPQRSLAIQLRELGDLLDGQLAEAPDGVFDGDLARLDLFEEFPQRPRIHRARSITRRRASRAGGKGILPRASPRCDPRSERPEAAR